ncbi:MAG: hypothetical protein JXR51_02095 [Bacteroidales bacterium]|nr:hypothetical protein [Bacteroidales bacterium]MBN2755938.1 hypothetical protein [Bacteroidales bacterium]
MININIKDIYFELLNNYANNKTLEVYWYEIANKYNSKKRFYHNLNHIKEMIVLSNIYKSDIYDLSSLQLSIFYHDIIYNSEKKDNELKSAFFAKNHLEKINFPIEKIEKCFNFILATKSHESANENDLKFLLDFDLAKLGAEWTDYELYYKQIRKEYYIFPNIIYNDGRRKVLKHFLKQERIFKTDIFFINFETKAKNNIEKELRILT